MDDYIEWDATALAGFIAGSDVAATKFAAAAMAEIKRLDRKIGAVVETWPDAIASDPDQLMPDRRSGSGSVNRGRSLR